MRRVLMLLLAVLSASLCTAQVSPCLDLTNSANQCSITGWGFMDLAGCGITDDDVEAGHLGSCFDAVGPQNILILHLWNNDLTTLPSGIFDLLTALNYLYLYQNDLTSLPVGIFDSLAALIHLYLWDNNLTTLPSGVFDSLTALDQLILSSNDLTTLPVGIFDSLTALTSLHLHTNDLTTLPAGIFDSLMALTALYVYNNPDLECLPPLPSSTVNVTADDSVGTECGCELADGTNPCDEDVECTPGAEGYTCGGCDVSNANWIGDGWCDTGDYNTAECGWDGGDCCECTCDPNAQYTCGQHAAYDCLNPEVNDCGCDVSNPDWIGDGWCDTGDYNTAQCGWDGGDCCECTCDPNAQYTCGQHAAYDCLNPYVGECG